ncbi:YIEGIA family protein [Bacillus sp. FJAT-27245]|uniref:YIEGIA family protein n=1 Tax=Bacillus sp. FJAT-27245 TaxID=1684144 RepID=UPI0006A7B828|nr:YIEGIA family protein [Bacillus sp. FJAT-27245]
MNAYTMPIIAGMVSGIIVRIYMLRSDYRQYPTYLHGRIVHISVGVIAAGLGAVAIPSIMEKEFTAVTFLALAATQFREVRNMERNTLTVLDGYELVPRGSTYIEGIAIAFESRNYLVILTALTVTLAYLAVNFIVAALVAIAALLLSKVLMSGGTINRLADIEYVKPHFDGPGLYVGSIYIMNIGLPDRRKEILENGMGFILMPKNANAKITIANLGQRQAILHDVSTALGVYRDSGTPALVPLAKLDLKDGRLGVFVLPHVSDPDKAIEVIGAVPALENAIRMPAGNGNG